MGIYENSLEAALRSVARNPEWADPSFPDNDPSLLPELASHGAKLNNAPKCVIWFAPRELVHGHGARVRVTTVDDTATYTVTLGGTFDLDHDYAALGGDLEADIVDGLASAINTGTDLGTLGGATLTYATAGPDTITRGAGDWEADGLQAGDRVTATGTASNDGITYTVATVTTTVLTLVSDDAVVPEASTVTAFVVQRPVVASRETRNGVETLVITMQRVHTEVDNPTNTFTTAVSATGTGALEFDEDALGGDITVLLVAAGSGGLRPNAAQWIFARNGLFASIDYLGLVERADTAGFGRIYPRLTNLTSPTTGAVITYTLKVAPSILESQVA